MRCLLLKACFRIRTIIPAILLLLFPFFSIAQTFVGVSSSPTDNGSQIGPTVTITPPAGLVAGDLVVIYAHYRLAGASLSMAATGGQAWTSETTASGSNQTFNIFWCRFNGTWGANPSITVGAGTNALTAVMYVFRPTSATNSWGVHMAAANTSSNATTNTITGYNTTASNTITMAFWCNTSATATTWTGLTGTGWTKGVLSAQYRNTSGNPQSHTAAYNIQGSPTTISSVSQNQGALTTTLRSILTWYEVVPPANDLCSSAISLTSTPSPCVSSTSGTLVGATYSNIASLGCGPADANDVWYSFVAKSTNPTIALSSAPTTARAQLFASNCGGTPLATCATGTSFTPAGLTIGQTYYVRVYSTTNAAGTFNICITDPAPSNDNCTGTLLTSSTTCTPTTGTMQGATLTAGTITANCATTPTYDVWYRFVAQSASPTITLSNLGSGFTSPNIQLLNGCGTGTALSCGTTSITSAYLTIGSTYYVRVYSSTGTAPADGFNMNFDICVTDPISPNDECNQARPLTPAIACSNITSNAFGATLSSTPIAPCAGTATYDLWYYFVAPADNATISLSGFGSNLNSTHFMSQLFSGDCNGLVSRACGTNTLTASSLTPGAYYYVRVYSTGPLPASSTNSNFNICVTFVPPATLPVNDDCATPTTLQVNGNCAKTIGTMANATASGIASSCGGATGIDVWYQFTATASNPIISLGDLGSNYPASANRRIQLFSGTCASLVSLYCNTGTSINATGLAIGATYYIRVFATNTTAPTDNADFSICVYNPPPAQRIGNSYVNITKKTTGGVVEPGDILEIRMTVNHTSGTIQNMRYLDNVPSNTAMLTGATDRISVITNEGVAIQNYTPATGDDAATYLATPPAGYYQIRMNLDFGSTTSYVVTPGIPADNSSTESASAIGDLASGDIPKGGGGSLFATAYRVQVTGNVGDTIKLNGGKFIYKQTSGGPDITLSGTPYQILISSPMSLCANAVGVNMSQESGGTFGTGTSLNRGFDLASPITGYSFVNASAVQAVGDGQYAIVKNMSPRSGTNRNAERNPVTATQLPYPTASAYRMYGHWDIDGDHTGTSNSIGNAPLSDGINGSYMLMVNADFVASETYRQTLTNLCPNTYYEFSAWFRNICPTCGIDYVTGSNYSPRQPGVMPNLTFTLDGLDKYSTGEIPYYSSGSTANGWVKKGFVFITGPTQTSATFTIRNNSQGGGGNDWAMDDIAIATCLPNMNYTPSTAPAVCMNNALVVDNTITSYFNSYNHYKWQRRANGSPTWTDIAGQSGSATPTSVSGQWQYMISYTIPPAYTTMANNGDQYRVIVSTSTSNLSDASCQVTDGISQITLTVNNCAPVLGTNIVSFNANTNADNAILKWTTDKESEPFQFIIERSTNGMKFIPIATVASSNNFDNSLNTYSWSEPYSQGKYYYRVKMVSSLNGERYSKVASIGSIVKAIESVSILNPFSAELITHLQVANTTNATLQLVDNSGRVVRTQNYILQAGQNRLIMENVKSLSQGFYTIRITVDQNTITKKLLKQ